MWSLFGSVKIKRLICSAGGTSIESLLEHVAQTPLLLATVYDAHDSVSLGSDEMSHGSDENLNARLRDENSASANDKFLVMI